MKDSTRNPVTLVDGWLIWKGGYSRKITWKERVLWRLGLLRTVKW